LPGPALVLLLKVLHRLGVLFARFPIEPLEDVQLGQLEDGFDRIRVDFGDLLENGDRLDGEAVLHVGVAQFVKRLESLGGILLAEVEIPDGIQQREIRRVPLQDHGVLLDRIEVLPLADKLLSLLHRSGFVKSHSQAPAHREKNWPIHVR
jgi:hypothetical protein